MRWFLPLVILCGGLSGWASSPPGSVLTLSVGRTSEVVLSPDGQFLFSVEGEKIVRWELNTGRRVQEYQGHKGLVLCVALSPDGRRLYSGSTDQRVLAWEVYSGQVLSALSLPADVWALTAGDQWVAAGLSNGKVWILAAQELSLRLELSTESPGVLSLNLGKEGLAGGGSDGKLYFWRLPSGERISSIPAHKGPIWALARCPGYVATASGDRTVRIWTFSEAQLLRTLAGHKGTVWDLAFLGEGAFLVTVSGDLTARLWDVARNEEVAVLRAHAAAVKMTAACPSGRLFLTGSEDGKIIVWDLKTILALRPRVVQALYSKEITRSQHIIVSVVDEDADIIEVKLVIEEGYPGTVGILPGTSFNPQIRGRTQGNFGFTVTVSQPQRVRISVILVDAAGFLSSPFPISFEAR